MQNRTARACEKCRSSFRTVASRVTSWLPTNVCAQLPVHERVVPAERVVELVEVAVVERGPDRLPHLVLGDRVEPGLGRVGGVVAVDHLAEEPGAGERLAHGGHRLGPERRRHRVRGVEPPPARAPAEPVGHHLDHVGQDGGLVVVELDELAVALEDRVVRPVRCPLEPAGRRRPRPAGQRRLEGGERTRPTWLNTPSRISRRPRWSAAVTRASKSSSSPSLVSILKWSVVSYPWVSAAKTGPSSSPLQPSSTA